MGNSMATHNKYKSFLFFIRKFKVIEPDPPQDLEEAFSKFTGGGSHMSVEQLHRFMVEHQGEEHHTLSDSEKVFERVLQERNTCQETVKVDHHREHEITLDELFRFLLHNDFNGPLKTQVSSSPWERERLWVLELYLWVYFKSSFIPKRLISIYTLVYWKNLLHKSFIFASCSSFLCFGFSC